MSTSTPSHSHAAPAWRIAWARVTAADPGRTRFRVALAATVSLGVVLGIEYLYAKVIGTRDTQTVMMLGAISAMQISVSLMQPAWQQRLRMVAWQPVVTAAGVALGMCARPLGGTAAELSGFVVVTFVAVIARRFGPQFVTIGLLGWVGYFISAFLAPPASLFPALLGAEILSAATVFGLSLLLWGHRPATALRNSVQAWEYQTSLLLGTAARLTQPGISPSRRARLRRRLRSQSVRVSDTAVTIEGWLARLGPSDGADPALARERLFEAHLALDTVVDASLDLALNTRSARDSALSDVSQLLDCLAFNHDDDAAAHALRLSTMNPEESMAGGIASAEIQRLAAAGLALLQARRHDRASAAPATSGAGVGAAEQGRTPLPPLTRPQPTQPRRTQKARHLTLPSRQAIQATVAVTVALPIAYVISPVHYLWALVAVFIVFLGPTTRGEVAVKATHRAIGTIIGLLIAIPLAAFTAGNVSRVLLVVLVACFVGHYLMNVRYSYLMLCITVGVLQLYDFMGDFTLQLLGLRLVETVLGAVIAAAAAYWIVPVRTRDTSAHLARGFFHAVAELLSSLADKLQGDIPFDVSELATAIRAVDDQARRHRAAGAPITWHPGRRSDRQAIDLTIATLAYQLRQTAAWVRTGERGDETIAALRTLADMAEQLAQREEVTWPAARSLDHDHHHTGHHPLRQMHDLLQHGQAAH